MNKVLTILIVLIVIIAGGFLLAKNRGDNQGQNPTDNSNNTNSNDSSGMQFSFNTPKKSAHYESNTPEHGVVLADAPINVVINFNFDLAPPSAISITKDGKEYGTGDLVIDTNKLSMRRNLDTSAPDGLYKVTYNACWPDRSCHDGHFEFAMDRTKASSYEDMTNRKEVTIKMSDLMFKPHDIKITSGTKVTWINDEAVEHYVNTDSHPAHTYYLGQNSRALKQGETYSVTFTNKGAYPYHCSAHANVMSGNIIVQ
ncbi:MAG TPA: plastocyanin/azurin family copper-binding protein [Verrucomicrobiae bacterium]|nr:plastocyanin/azurin family copper-binding protein [Verrucomicrobiae bacterium]